MSIVPKTSRISIVIPTLDEAARLPATLQAVHALSGVEVLVVDGGSRDATVAVALAHGARVLTAPPGRARQMNAGAAAASGGILLFLHADTVLPAGFVEQARRALAGPQVVAGAFRLGFAGDAAPGLGIVAWGANLRSRWLQLPYGDQAIFLARERFLAVGGFPELPLLEDVALVRNLRRQGRIVLLSQAVTTSDRRWRQRGVVANTLKNLLILMGFFGGVAPRRLAVWYRLGEEG